MTSEATLAALQDFRALMDYMDKKQFDHQRMGDGAIYIAAGQGIRPFTKRLFFERATEERIDDVKDYHASYRKDRDQMLEWVKTLPSHYQYLKDNIYV